MKIPNFTKIIYSIINVIQVIINCTKFLINVNDSNKIIMNANKDIILYYKIYYNYKNIFIIK